MKPTYSLFIAAILLLAVTSCTKYESNIDLDANIIKQANLNSDIQKKLADAPFGWLLMVPSLDTNIRSAVPILLRFDTAKNTFTSKSPFQLSTSTVPSLYELSSATGAPLLSFATGSIFSSWYEAGGITDYYFKVLDAKTDTITMQPYRKGTIYASEGGLIMKMVRQKAPLTYYDNPFDLPSILTGNTAPFWNSLHNTLQLNYPDGYHHPTLDMEFDKQSAGNLSFFQTYVPFCRDLKMVPIFLFLNDDYNNPVVYYCGVNTLFAHIDNGFSPTPWFIDGPTAFMRAIKTDYLLVRKVSDDLTQLELFAVDINGKEIISGTLTVD